MLPIFMEFYKIIKMKHSQHHNSVQVYMSFPPPSPCTYPYSLPSLYVSSSGEMGELGKVTVQTAKKIPLSIVNQHLPIRKFKLHSLCQLFTPNSIVSCQIYELSLLTPATYQSLISCKCEYTYACVFLTLQAKLEWTSGILAMSASNWGSPLTAISDSTMNLCFWKLSYRRPCQPQPF